MSSYTKSATEAGDQFLEMLAAYQDVMLQYYKGSLVSSGNPLPVSRSSLTLMQDISKASFTFWESFLAQQKKFVEGLFESGKSKPVRAQAPASKAASTQGTSTKRSSTKAASRKTPARRTRSAGAGSTSRRRGATGKAPTTPKT